MAQPFDAHALLGCYARGIFPMAESRDDPSLFFLDPDMRGVMPLDGLHISRSLAKHLRRDDYTVSFNTDFLGTVRMCAEPMPGRKDTWINPAIESLYEDLHLLGHAHSVEVYATDTTFIGGLYGVSLGGAFFGESMFSRRTDASKIALVHLVQRLNARGFSLLDMQFLTPHLASLGGIEISRADYHAKLDDALGIDAMFNGSKSV